MDAEDVECGGEADELTNVKMGQEKPSAKASSGNALQYIVEDVPPPHLAFLFGLQQVLLSISSTISIPLIVANEICAGDLDLVKSQIMSTFLFMCGVCTLLQTTVGVRLPIIQGGCHKFVPAVMALMALPAWKCPDISSASLVNTSINYSINNYSETNLSISDMDKGEFRTEIWQRRMREVHTCTTDFSSQESFEHIFRALEYHLKLPSLLHDLRFELIYSQELEKKYRMKTT